MTRKLNMLFAAATLLTGISATTAVFAADSTPAPQPASMQGMMGDHGGMMNMMGHMGSDQAKQTNPMKGGCGHMMDDSKKMAPMGSGQEAAPAGNN